MIQLEKVRKCYADAGVVNTILNDLSLTVAAGQSMSIQGASGSGKSTLLHLLAALDKPSSGRILLSRDGTSTDITQFNEGQADKYRQRTVGLIFQKFNLIDCISVLDNIMLPAKIAGATDLTYIQNLLQALDIERHIKKLPNQLSGGEQQRVAIARGLSHKPPLLLADEPTGNLDSKNSEIVSKLLVNTCRMLKTSLVMVTHSEKVARLTQQQWFLDDGGLTQI